MFLGELACLFAFIITRGFDFGYKLIKKNNTENLTLVEEVKLKNKDDKEKANPLVFWIPALCDLTGTTLLNFGLFFTFASVYQMLRGSVVIFNAIFACIFLKQKLSFHRWFGIVLIVIGLGIVGSSSVIYSSGSASGARNPFLGNILVVTACVIQAVQFVAEEKFVGKYDASPLECVGWEGFFGWSMSIIILFVIYFLPGSDGGSVESGVYAFGQLIQSPILLFSVLGSATSIAFFNFIGITITKRVSSTTRSTIDACRTMFIWAISLILGWESFKLLQLGGFAVLVSGTFFYNGVIRIPVYHGWYLKREFIRNNASAVENIYDEDELVH